MAQAKQAAADADDRTLPSNLEAERSVLGAILVHNAAWPQAAATVRTEDFYRDAHRRIFDAMTRLVAAGSPIDFTLLREELRRSGEEDAAGGPAYIASLADGVPRSTNMEHYCLVVRGKSRLREAIYAANRILTRAYMEDALPEIVEDGVRKLMAIADQPGSGAVSITDAVLAYTSGLDDGAVTGLPTGFRELDGLLGGLRPKALTIVAARPGAGKTTFAVNVADQMARAGLPTAIFTLEMSVDAVAAQVLAANAHVPADRMRRKLVSDDRDWTRINDALAGLQGRPLYIVESATTLTQVAAWSRRLKDERGIRAVFVDYLQLLSAPGVKDRQQEIAYLSRGLARLAKDLDIAVVALSQLSREPERRTDKRPHLSDLRESGSLEQDARLVLLIFRSEMYDRDPQNPAAGIAEIIVAKNTFGPVGLAKLAFLADVSRFADLAL